MTTKRRPSVAVRASKTTRACVHDPLHARMIPKLLLFGLVRVRGICYCSSIEGGPASCDHPDGFNFHRHRDFLACCANGRPFNQRSSLLGFQVRGCTLPPGSSLAGDLWKANGHSWLCQRASSDSLPHRNTADCWSETRLLPLRRPPAAPRPPAARVPRPCVGACTPGIIPCSTWSVPQHELLLLLNYDLLTHVRSALASPSPPSSPLPPSTRYSSSTPSLPLACRCVLDLLVLLGLIFAFRLAPLTQPVCPFPPSWHSLLNQSSIILGVRPTQLVRLTQLGSSGLDLFSSRLCATSLAHSTCRRRIRPQKPHPGPPPPGPWARHGLPSPPGGGAPGICTCRGPLCRLPFSPILRRDASRHPHHSTYDQLTPTSTHQPPHQLWPSQGPLRRLSVRRCALHACGPL